MIAASKDMWKLFKKQEGGPLWQKVYPVYYKGKLVGGYIADIVVDNSIILELKAVKSLNECMEAQLINYLKISGIPVGYLVNFYNTCVKFKRFVCTRRQLWSHNWHSTAFCCSG